MTNKQPNTHKEQQTHNEPNDPKGSPVTPKTPPIESKGPPCHAPRPQLGKHKANGVAAWRGNGFLMPAAAPKECPMSPKAPTVTPRDPR